MVTTPYVNVVNGRPTRRHQNCVDKSTLDIIAKPCRSRRHRFLDMPTLLGSQLDSLELMIHVLEFDVQVILHDFACTLSSGCSESVVTQIGQSSEEETSNFTMFHGYSFTMDTLQIMSEYYANLTFIVKKVSKMKRDLILRADNPIDRNTYTLLNDLRTMMCQIRHNITEDNAANGSSNSAMANLGHDINSPCIGMSSDHFYIFAIRLLYKFQTVLQYISHE